MAKNGGIMLCKFEGEDEVHEIKGTVQNTVVGSLLLVSVGVPGVLDPNGTFEVLGKEVIDGQHVHVVEFFDDYATISSMQRETERRNFGGSDES